jgi:hypothetical protein
VRSLKAPLDKSKLLALSSVSATPSVTDVLYWYGLTAAAASQQSYCMLHLQHSGGYENSISMEP